MEKPWTKLYPKGTPTSLEYPKTSVFETLRNAANKYPDKVALVFQDNAITYKKLDVLTDTLATFLHDLGMEKGDRVALFLPNIPQFIISFYGGLKAGAIITACSALYKERELSYQLHDSGAETIVTLDEFYPTVNNIKRKTMLKNVIVTTREESNPSMLLDLKIKRAKQQPMTINFSDILKEYEAKPPKLTIDPKEDLAVLQYTGGTTGVPKGAMLTHYNLIVNQVRHTKWCEAREGRETSMIFLPMYHIYGLNECMASAIYMSAKIILIERFEAGEVLKAIAKYRPTFLYCVPTVYIAFLAHQDIKDHDFSSIRVCLSAAAPLPFEIRKKWKETTGLNIIEGWGLTEASPNLTYTLPGMAEPKLIGVPAFNTDVKVVDTETGTQTLPPRKLGELIARGPQVMKGYWNKPEETEQTLRDGWLYTGDIGYMDEDGCFYFVDRKKDMINAAGFKVWPFEVEEILHEHPAVREAAVVGISDPYRGESVKAFVVPHDRYKGKIAEKDLINFCKNRLAVYKAPTIIEFRDALPKTHVGKILRRVLRVDKREA